MNIFLPPDVQLQGSKGADQLAHHLCNEHSGQDKTKYQIVHLLTHTAIKKDLYYALELPLGRPDARQTLGVPAKWEPSLSSIKVFENWFSQFFDCSSSAALSLGTRSFL